VYHYAGNNPVKLVDPDGRDIEIDYNNKIIYADANNVRELDEANRYLMGFKAMEEWNDMKVITRDENKNNVQIFTDPVELLCHIESLDPTMSEKDKTRIVGGAVAIAGLGIMAVSIYGMKANGPSSTDAGPAKGLVIGVQMLGFGFLQAITGEDIVGTAADFIDTLFQDPKIPAIRAIINSNPRVGK